jgi:hypothetical protein
VDTLCGLSFEMGLAGAVLNLVAAIILLVLTPSRPRYLRPTDDAYSQDLGLRRLVGDQSKIAALVVVGGVLQLGGAEPERDLLRRFGCASYASNSGGATSSSSVLIRAQLASSRSTRSWSSSDQDVCATGLASPERLGDGLNPLTMR